MSPLERRRSLCCGPSLCPSLPSVVWWGRWPSRSSSKPWAGETQAQNIHQLWAFSVCTCALERFSPVVTEMSLYCMNLWSVSHINEGISSRLLTMFLFFINCETTACRHLVDQLITARKFKAQTDSVFAINVWFWLTVRARLCSQANYVNVCNDMIMSDSTLCLMLRLCREVGYGLSIIGALIRHLNWTRI